MIKTILDNLRFSIGIIIEACGVIMWVIFVLVGYLLGCIAGVIMSVGILIEGEDGGYSSGVMSMISKELKDTL